MHFSKSSWTWMTTYLAVGNATQQDTFDPREASIQTIHTALFSGLTTCRYVVESYLARIEKFNPIVNAISSLNPDALSIADEMDVALARGNATGSLFCIPILLKDNYDATPMNTTGSSLGFVGLKPTVDAPTVAAFRRQGAVILGKSSLHEMALEGLSVSSYGGQVVNPYDHTRTPGGSSGGTGAAVASSFAVFGTGTDTVNSLRSPANANSLFSFRPTRGLISRAGVMPISYTQDVAGAIGRSVEDIAVAMTVMASVGYDANDNLTALTPGSSKKIDYSRALYGPFASVRGRRFGVVQGFFDQTSSNETTPVNTAFSKMADKLRAAGAILVPINSTALNSTQILATCDVQQFEYRQQMDAYLSRPSVTGNFPATLEALYRNTSSFLVIPSQYSYVQNSLVSSTTAPANISTYTQRLHNITNLQLLVSEVFAENALDAFIYPQQSRLVVPIGSPSQAGRNGILGAVTGFPAIQIPMGFSEPTSTAPIGVPIGMDIYGLPWQEENLLGMAKAIQDLTRVRKMPPGEISNTVQIQGEGYQGIPKIVPNRGNVSPNYPVGTFK